MTKQIFLPLFFSIFFSCLGQEYKMLEKKFLKQEGNVMSVDISSDKMLIAAGSDDNFLRIWDVNTGELKACTNGHVGTVNMVKFTNDNRYILTAGDRIIRMWDISAKLTKTFKGHVTHVWSFDVDNNEKRLVSGSYEDKIKVWDMLEAKELMSIQGHEKGKSVLSVCFSPDGNHIASGSLDRTIRIWNAQTGEQTHIIRGHSGNIFDLEFTPDSKYLLSASDDKTIKIWDLSTSTSVRTLKGHQDAVMSISISPDGKHILSASIDKTIILWNATDGKNLYCFNEHSGKVHAVKYASDGLYFVSGADNKELFYWKINNRVYVDAYFRKELQEEIESNRLFRPKGNDEKATEYKERQIKQEEFKNMLYEKYYNQYMLMMKHKPIQEPENINVKINMTP